MTKILVLSDSHGFYDTMTEIVRKERPSLIFHLGDHIRDSERLAEEFFHIPVRRVVGNCDYYDPGPEFVVDELEGVRIYACHGHRYNVKYGLMRLGYAAREMRADLCLFGHTHIPFLEENGELTLFNPGAVNSSNPSYGVITVNNGTFTCSLKRLSET